MFGIVLNICNKEICNKQPIKLHERMVAELFGLDVISGLKTITEVFQEYSGKIDEEITTYASEYAQTLSSEDLLGSTADTQWEFLLLQVYCNIAGVPVGIIPQCEVMPVYIVFPRQLLVNKVKIYSSKERGNITLKPRKKPKSKI